MKVESQEMLYLEKESKVVLSPWAKFTRASMTLEGKGALVTLDKEAIRQVDTTDAKGVDTTPGRRLDYTAQTLKMSLSEKSQVEKIEASGNANMVATTEQAITTTHADRVDMTFAATDKETVLRRVLASGNAEVQSKPVARPNVPLPETKILRSAVVDLAMRDNGREITTMDTQSAGVLEFHPNRPGQHKRRVDGEQFHVEYGPRNQVDTFRVSKAQTRTENDPKQGKPQPPSLTWSRDLNAWFAPRTGEMTRMEQSGDFRYEEGDRKARSERALLDQASGRITLVQNARVSDATGSTAADQIILDQKSEDFVAQGNVSSSRIPDRKGSGSAMLSKDEPMQAKAARMNTYDKQSLVVYEGNAMLWQAASRIQADKIEIDRKNGQMRANGKVVTQVQDQAKSKPEGKTEGKKGAKPPAPVFTLITAPAMIYYDKDRLAHYTGGAFLRRDLLDVKAREIRAYLTPEQKEEPKVAGKPPVTAEAVAVAAAPPKQDEGTSLDDRQAGRRQAVDQLDLGGERNRLGFVLQSVARADFHHADLAGEGHDAASKLISSTPSATESPARNFTAFTTPSAWAAMVCSIFIASTTISGWPRFTLSPAAAMTRTTVPGMGEARWPWPSVAASASARMSTRPMRQDLPRSIRVMMPSASMAVRRRRPWSPPAVRMLPSSAGLVSTMAAPASTAMVQRPPAKAMRASLFFAAASRSRTADPPSPNTRQPLVTAQGECGSPPAAALARASPPAFSTE